MADLEETLTDRNKTHGDYVEQACLSQFLKRPLRESKNWDVLPTAMQESLEMIMLKISRIMSGDYMHADSWHDIAGYAKLVEKYIAGIPPNAAQSLIINGWSPPQPGLRPST